MTQIRC